MRRQTHARSLRPTIQDPSLKKGCSMTRLAISRIKPIPWLIPQSSQAALLLSLFLITSFGAACSGAKQNSAPDSSTPSSASSSSSSTSHAGGAFEGAVTAKMFTGDQPVEIRYAIKGARTRVETQLSRGGAQVGVMLMDMSSGAQTMLMPQTKTYMTMNWVEEGK